MTGPKDGRAAGGEAESKPEDRADSDDLGRAYPAAGITVYFNTEKCTHSANCVRGLPLVFDVGRRPWIRSDLDTPEAIAAQIDRCPSGALQYVLHPEPSE